MPRRKHDRWRIGPRKKPTRDDAYALTFSPNSHTISEIFQFRHRFLRGRRSSLSSFALVMHRFAHFASSRRNLILLCVAAVVVIFIALWVSDQFLQSDIGTASADQPKRPDIALYKDLLHVVLVPIFIAYFSWYLATKDRDRRYGPITLVPGERKNTILMLGLGRTGKSSIVNALAGREITGTEDETEKFEIWQYYQRHPRQLLGVGIQNRKLEEISEKPINFYIPDYRGQNLSKLIRGFLAEQTKPETPLRYGDINTLLLVVDIAPEKQRRNGSRYHDNVDGPDPDRVEAHLRQWSTTALDAVFGLLTEEEFQSIILLINKYDLLTNSCSHDENKSVINECFSSLIDDLKRRGKGENSIASFHIVHASATAGTGIVGTEGLQRILFESSVPQPEA